MHNRRKSTCLALEMFYMPLCDDCGGDEFWSCVGSIFRGFRRSVAQALISFLHIYTIYMLSETCISIYADKIKDIRPDIVSYTITKPPLQLWKCRRSYTYGCVYHEEGEPDFPNQWSPIVVCQCMWMHIYTQGVLKNFHIVCSDNYVHCTTSN